MKPDEMQLYIMELEKELLLLRRRIVMLEKESNTIAETYGSMKQQMKAFNKYSEEAKTGVRKPIKKNGTKPKTN